MIEVAAGTAIVVDDGFAFGSLFGAAARLYLRPRVSIGPEVTYVSGTGIDGLQAFGNVTLDLRASNATREVRFTPFVVVGAGVSRLDDGFTTETSPGIAAGVGLRFVVRGRLHAGAEWGVRGNGLRFAAMAGVTLQP